MLKENMSCSLEKIVVSSETALNVGSGKLEVFSTPSLIAFMEKTAFLCVDNFLDEGDTTVGISINTKHLKANLIGDELNSKATLVKIDGRKLSFDVVVTFNDTIVGSCYHERFIVNGEKFINKLNER